MKCKSKYAKGNSCKEVDTCVCSISALEPNDNCPIHGHGPKRKCCKWCGRYIKAKDIIGGK